MLHLITRMILGGAQENTLFTVEGLLDRPRYEVMLATGPALGPEGSLLDRARRNNVPVYRLPSLRRNILPIHDAKATGELLQLLRIWQPDLIHTHSSKAGILGRFCADLKDVPHIIHTIHGLPFHPFQSSLKFHSYALFEKWAAARTDRMIAVCKAMREQALDAGVGTRDQYRIVYSGMEMEPFLTEPPEQDLHAFRKRWGLDPGQTVLTKIARIAPLKGHQYVFSVLPELMSEHPDLHLFLVGDGTERTKFENRAEKMGVRDRVTFTGLLPPDQIPLALHASDLVVHASLREGLARVLPQALLSGVPVVTFDVDGAPEVIRPGETGWLVPPKDTGRLFEALHEALTHLPAARSLARTGRERCRAKFGHRKMVDEIDRIYQDLI